MPVDPSLVARCQQNPDDAEVWLALSEVSLEQGLLHQALAAAGHVMERHPQLPAGHLLAARCLAASGRREDAWHLLHGTPLPMRHDDPDVVFGRAWLAEELGWESDAWEGYRALLTRWPNHYPALNNWLLLATRRQAWSVVATIAQQFVRAYPDDPLPHRHAAEAALGAAQLELAEQHFARCQALRPDDEISRFGLAMLQAARRYQEDGQEQLMPDTWQEWVLWRWLRAGAREPDDIQHFSSADAAWMVGHHAQTLWQWQDRSCMQQRFMSWLHTDPAPDDPALRQARWFELLGLPRTPPDEQRMAEALARRAHQQVRARQILPWQPSRQVARMPGQPIRVGYLCADVYDHVVGVLLAPVLQAHDPARIELHVINSGHHTPEDNVTLRIRMGGGHYHDARNSSDAALIAQLRRLRLDVLVDASAWFPGGRGTVLAARVAPVQVGYIGYVTTYGRGLMDYVVADPWCMPAEVAPQFQERLLYVRTAYLPFRLDDMTPPAGAPTRRHLPPSTGVTFGCLNSPWKIEPEVVAAWGQILAEVPESRLVVLTHHPAAEQRLRQALEKWHIAPERLVFVARVAYAELVGLMSEIDVYLDTWVYNAMSTAAPVLAAGTPLVTLRGSTFNQQVGAQLAVMAGVPECVASSPADYVALAVRLGRDAAWRAALRLHLKAQCVHGPMFDFAGHMRDWESALETLVDQVAAGGGGSFCVWSGNT